jgi:hypothetical protein
VREEDKQMFEMEIAEMSLENTELRRKLKNKTSQVSYE